MAVSLHPARAVHQGMSPVGTSITFPILFEPLCRGKLQLVAIFAHPLPVRPPWLLVDEMWSVVRPAPLMFFVGFDCLLRSDFSQLASIIQVGVIPFEVDVTRNVNLHDLEVLRRFLL